MAKRFNFREISVGAAALAMGVVLAGCEKEADVNALKERYDNCENLLVNYSVVEMFNPLVSDGSTNSYPSDLNAPKEILRNVFETRRPLSFEVTSKPIDLDGDGEKELVGVSSGSLPKSYKYDYSVLYIFKLADKQSPETFTIKDYTVESDFERYSFHNIDGPTFSAAIRLNFVQNDLTIPNLAGAYVEIGKFYNHPLLKIQAEESIYLTVDTEPAKDKSITLLGRLKPDRELIIHCWQYNNEMNQAEEN